MRPPLDGTVLITGASSGIGREMARQLAPATRKLILVARRDERLKELRDEIRRDGLEIDVRPCDLADAAAVERLVAEVGEVDVLINNAGLGDVGLFEFSDWTKIDALLRVGVFAPALLTHRLLGPMLRKGRGGILNVSSGWGLTFIPGVAAYAGAKHFLTAFTECLRLELRGTGVVVSQVCPGPIDTEFEAVAGNPTGRDIPPFLKIDAARCAREGLRGFARGRAIIVPGTVMKLLVGLGRISPRWLLRMVYAWIGAWLRKRQGAAISPARGA